MWSEFRISIIITALGLLLPLHSSPSITFVPVRLVSLRHQLLCGFADRTGSTTWWRRVEWIGVFVTVVPFAPYPRHFSSVHRAASSSSSPFPLRFTPFHWPAARNVKRETVENERNHIINLSCHFTSFILLSHFSFTSLLHLKYIIYIHFQDLEELITEVPKDIMLLVVSLHSLPSPIPFPHHFVRCHFVSPSLRSGTVWKEWI